MHRSHINQLKTPNDATISRKNIIISRKTNTKYTVNKQTNGRTDMSRPKKFSLAEFHALFETKSVQEASRKPTVHTIAHENRWIWLDECEYCKHLLAMPTHVYINWSSPSLGTDCFTIVKAGWNIRPNSNGEWPQPDSAMLDDVDEDRHIVEFLDGKKHGTEILPAVYENYQVLEWASGKLVSSKSKGIQL